VIITSIANGQDAYMLSDNGRYVIFEAVLSDTTEGAFMVEIQGPPPVPDGSSSVPGTQMLAQRNVNGTDIDVTWDVTGCPAPEYNLFYGDLSGVSTYTYTGAACGIGTTGQATFTPPSGDLFFMIASEDGTGIEGVHGYDSQGRARPASAGGMCGVTNQIRSARCP
jgi:hypothetical protein